MKRLLRCINHILLFSFIFLPVLSGDPITKNQALEIIWLPEDTNFARIGFSDEPVSSITVDPSSSSSTILKLDSIEREGNSLVASNTIPLHVYCQFYGNQVFYADLYIGYLENSEYPDKKIPISVEYDNTMISSGDTVSAFFSYDTTEAVYADSVELDISAVIPDNTPSASYSGYITMELRFQ